MVNLVPSSVSTLRKTSLYHRFPSNYFRILDSCPFEEIPTSNEMKLPLSNTIIEGTEVTEYTVNNVSFSSSVNIVVSST